MARRAQMEILGLAVVIILVVMGLIFYLKLSGNSEVDRTKIENRNNADSLDAIIKTTVSCGNAINSPRYQLIDIIKDCTDTPANKICSNSCAFVASESKKMLELTLEKWGKRYYFAVKNKQGDVLGNIAIKDSSNQNGDYDCSLDTVPGIVTTQPIRTRSGNEVRVVLKVCG